MFRTLAIAILPTLLLLLGSLAPAAAQATESPRRMVGRASLEQSRSQTRLLLRADSTDSSGWHLEVALVPQTRSIDPRPSRPQSRQVALWEGREKPREGRESSRRERRESKEDFDEEREDEDWDDEDQHEDRDDEDEHEGKSRGGSTPSRQGGAFDLAGRFTLSGPNVPTVAGIATGQMGQDGTGRLRLEGDGSAVALTAAFAADGGGRLRLELAGALPSAPQAVVAADVASPGDHLFWYISRAAGLSAYLMLFVNVVLGLAVRTRFLDALLARWRSHDLHQFTALLALGFLALHTLSLLGDRYIGFRPEQLLIPLASPYRPLWTALGVLAAYALVVIVASFYVRGFIGHRVWRALHYTAFVAYLLALAHGVLSGTDTGEPWAQALYWSTGMAVAILVGWRFRGILPGYAAETRAQRPATVQREGRLS